MFYPELLEQTQKQWSFYCSNSFSVFTFTLTEDLLYSIVQNNLSCSYSTQSGIYLTWSKRTLFNIKTNKILIQGQQKVNNTLWAEDSHAKAKGNWVFLIDGDVEPFLIGISASLFKNAIYEHSLLKWLAFTVIRPACGSRNLTLFDTGFFGLVLEQQQYSNLGSSFISCSRAHKYIQNYESSHSFRSMTS